ncbi:MAG: serine/threonine protein kinase [Planctomycetaceae bacterium]|nr:serine/threonine protein kinase [Planctomycetaceae bacterium]
MPHTTTLDELLTRWDEAYTNGREISAEELCRPHSSPDLLVAVRDHIRALKQMDGLLKTHCWINDQERVDTELGPVEPVTHQRYAIQSHLAKGGLGTVFVAEDQELRREVALKFILDRFASDADCLASFRAEREITARMQHPGIVPVYGVGQLASGRPFYVMRYVKGRSLKQAIADFYARTTGCSGATAGLPSSAGPAPAEREMEFHKLLTSFIAACHTVAYAHNRCVINRDLKPEHIMLGRYGETMVVDWGLAMRVDPPDATTDSGANTVLADPTTSNSSRGGAGTLMFMSPEQAAGAVFLTPATDIYSLGATLYVILTGQLPFSASGCVHELRQKVIRGEFQPPRRVNPSCSKALDAICRKAMAGRAEDRYPTAEALAADIERHLADQPVSVLPDTRGEAALRWTRRNRGAALTGLLSLVSLTVLAIIASLALLRSSREANAARQASLHTSATFAAKMLGREVENRWLALEVAAADPELIHLLRSWEREPDKSSGASPIHQDCDAWLAQQRKRFDATLPAFSWVVNDRRGIQVGRRALDGKEFHGESFAHRTYFHGRERELTTEQLDLALPIIRPNLSPVFENKSFADESERQHKLTVTCSVPIRDGREIVGVLGMSIEITAFEALRLDSAQQRMALLIDVRPDWRGDRGLVLFHGGQAARIHGKRPALNEQWPVAHADDLSRMLAPAAGGQVASGILPDFRNPEHRQAGGMIAGFAPVWVRPDRQKPCFSGWLVVVCEAAQ